MCFVVGHYTRAACASEDLGDMDERNTGVGESREIEAGKNAEAGGEAAGGEQDITSVLAQVSALQSEIDRLVALVNTAAKKLES